ncbi:hypothetical protein SAMN05421788_105343 [Filimonas lacunae]|uniref:Uncharacterized protein n=1 Tax=Filimonas lacunae TaxID=477680 RepID=A0A1N7QIH0_9BACT|nr:hypothetical protein SAMN05421788_105343 [Filimonas lacunae]
MDDVWIIHGRYMKTGNLQETTPVKPLISYSISPSKRSVTVLLSTTDVFLP